jgi:AcrR family transcriptional regulator
MKKETTKDVLLNAFDKSEKKTIADVVRIAGVTPSTFYFHYYKDVEFRKNVMEKQREHLNAKIEAVAA